MNCHAIEVASLLSNWFSGATLLTMLLDRHSKVTTNGELFVNLTPSPSNVCSCGAPLVECSFFKEAAPHMYCELGLDSSLAKTVPKMSDIQLLNRVLLNNRCSGTVRNAFIRSVPVVRDRVSHFLENHVRFMENACRIAHASLYLDGTKSIRRAELFLESGVIRKLVLLVRDPRAFAKSYLTAGVTPPGATLSMAIADWHAYLREVRKITSFYPEARVLTVRYEDVCEQPNETISTILQHLGLDYESRILEVKETSHHVFGHKTRKSFDGSIRTGESWSAYFSADQIRTIESHTAEEMAAFRYQPVS